MTERGGAEVSRLPAPRIVPYRLLFALSVGLYLACFAVGTLHVLLKRGHLPTVVLDPLAEGEDFERAGRLDRALREYRMVARIDRGDYDTVKRINAVAQRAGDPSGQIDQFLRARSIWPRDAATHTSLAWAYFNNRRFPEAEASFRDALRLDANRVEAQWGIGETLLEQDRLAGAISALRAAERMDPTRAATHNSLGIAYALSGARSEALASFETAIRLNPSPQYVQNLERARREVKAAGQP